MDTAVAGVAGAELLCVGGPRRRMRAWARVLSRVRVRVLDRRDRTLLGGSGDSA